MKRGESGRRSAGDARFRGNSGIPPRGEFNELETTRSIVGPLGKADETSGGRGEMTEA